MKHAAGLSLGVTTWFLPKRGRDGLRWAKDAGFDLVHLDRNDVVNNSPKAYRSVADDLGIKLAGLSVVEIEDLGIAGHDARDAVTAAIEMAMELSLGYVCLPAFGAAALPHDEAISMMANLLGHALKCADGTSLTVATENALDAEGLLKLFGLVPSDRLELLFDTQNPIMVGADPLSIIQTAGHYVRTFAHVKDGIRELGDCRIGDGAAHVSESIRTLVDAGFEGTFVLESDYRTGDTAAARLDQHRLRKLAALAGGGPFVCGD